MKYLYLLFSIFLIGCSNNQGSDSLNEALVKEPLLQPYVDSFYAMAKINHINTDFFNSIRLSYEINKANFPEENKIIGICYIDGQRSKIVINPFFWNNTNFDELDKRSLMFHELSHCLLFRNHVNGFTLIQYSSGYTRNIPISIMNQYHIGAFFSKSLPEERNFFKALLETTYLVELFDLSNKPKLFDNINVPMTSTFYMMADSTCLEN